MNKVSLIPLGVGEAFTAQYYTSCIALGIDGDWLLIDCPHPVRKMLREASIDTDLPEPLDLDRIHAVAVSHLHADHCCGLEDFGYYSFFALNRRAKLLMHPDASARLWDGLLAAGMEFMQAKPEAPPVQSQLSDYFELIDRCDESIAVLTPQTRRKPQNKLGPFKLSQPLGSSGGQGFGSGGLNSCWTGRAKLFDSQAAVGRDSALAVAANLEPIFTQ